MPRETQFFYGISSVNTPVQLQKTLKIGKKLWYPYSIHQIPS